MIKLLKNKVETAIRLIQACEPPEGYYLAFSGGKDSVVIYDLVIKAGVKFDAHYCVSPIDPPQIYQFIKEHYPSVQWDYHARGWWRMVMQKGLPLRHARWCCHVIKEAGGCDRMVILGNRRAEGGRIRRGQEQFEHIRKSNKFAVRPMIDFDNNEVWQYIRENDLPYCPLYDEGADRKGYGEGYFKRLGCVLCPFSRNIGREELYFPKIVKCWKRACDRIVADRLARGGKTPAGKPYKHLFLTGQEMYDWWVSRK